MSNSAEGKKLEAAVRRKDAVESEAKRLMTTPDGIREILRDWGLDNETIVALAQLQDDASVFAAAEFVGTFSQLVLDIADKVIPPVESFCDDVVQSVH